jgi:hypothetical protein
MYPFNRVNNGYVKAMPNIFAIIDKLKFYRQKWAEYLNKSQR